MVVIVVVMVVIVGLGPWAASRLSSTKSGPPCDAIIDAQVTVPLRAHDRP